MTLRDWVRCHLRDSTDKGKYLDALARERTGHEEKLPEWMAASQVEFMGKPAEEWR